MSQCSKEHMDKVAQELQALAHEVRGVDDLHLLVDAVSRGTVALRQATEDTSCERLSWKFQAALEILEWGMAEDRKLAKPLKKKAKIKPTLDDLALQSPYFQRHKMHQLYWRLQRRHQAVIEKLRRENDILGMQIQIIFYQEMLLAWKQDSIDSLGQVEKRSERHIYDLDKAWSKQKVLLAEKQAVIDAMKKQADIDAMNIVRCPVCFEAVPNILFSNCGHLALCESCEASMWKPECRHLHVEFQNDYGQLKCPMCRLAGPTRKIFLPGGA